MFDLWGFLLQTLTATGVAVLLLIIRRLFRDKLPPKWHFTVWGVLGIMILIPAGWNGRYTLVNWLFPIELLKGLAADYTITQVKFPLPVIREIPDTLTEWLFAVYVIGVIVHLARYLISYVRLRSALSKGHDALPEIIEQVEVVAQHLNVRLCRVIAVEGLPSAFVSGIFESVLAVPANQDIDDKIIMHELFHLKSHDTIWSVVICVLRSLHWCNPLIVYCAGCASNDMEARCDQYVLEQLEGEERREYGLTLLAMVNEQFAKTPGTTCVNNGGKRIRERIETIARFKKYPVGMRLVSICAVAVMMISLIAGTPATKVTDPFKSYNLFSYASARSVSCTTFAGAFDTYAKAVMINSLYYRMMCAPAEEQAELCRSKRDYWSDEIATLLIMESDYYVYNLQQLDEDTYEALMVFVLEDEDNENWEEYEMYHMLSNDAHVDYKTVDSYDCEDEYESLYVVVQDLRVKKESGRWVTYALNDFRILETNDVSLGWECDDIAGLPYTGTIGNFQVDSEVQSVYMIDNSPADQDDIFLGINGPYDLVAKPDAVFTSGTMMHNGTVTHQGSQEERDKITEVALRMVEIMPGEKLPKKADNLNQYGDDVTVWLSSSWDTVETSPGWGPYLEVNHGSGSGFDSPKNFDFPECYIANLFINKEFAGEVKLYPKESVAK